MLSAAYSPAAPDEHRLEATAEALYLMMGRGLERLPVRLPNGCGSSLSRGRHVVLSLRDL